MIRWPWYMNLIQIVEDNLHTKNKVYRLMLSQMKAQTRQTDRRDRTHYQPQSRMVKIVPQICMGANPRDMSPFLGKGRSCFLPPPLSVQNNCNIFHIACCIWPTYAILTLICIKFRWGEGADEAYNACTLVALSLGTLIVAPSTWTFNFVSLTFNNSLRPCKFVYKILKFPPQTAIYTVSEKSNSLCTFL